jgi:two-component system sensor kinase FixL
LIEKEVSRLKSFYKTLQFDRAGFLDTILDALPEAVIVIGIDAKIIAVNPAGLEMLGVSSLADLPKGGLLSLIAQNSIVTFQRHFDRIAAGEPHAPDQHLLVDVQTKDGMHRAVECQMVPLKSRDGIVEGVICTGRDVTKREVNLQPLTDNAALLSAILETVPDAMVVIDEHGLITSCSATAEMLFGYSARELLGKNVSLLMPEPYSSAHDGYIRRYRDTGEKRIIGNGRTIEGRRKDGSIFPIALSIGEARTNSHRAFTGFIHDLTEKNEAEVRLQEVQAELLHASRLSAAGTLASALAHELNQPLTAIANYVATGRDLAVQALPENSEIIQEALGEAAKEALRAGQIIRRMRDFVSKGELQLQILPLSELIDDATTLGLMGAREKGVSWSIEIEPGVDQVMADRVQVRQVMVNLIRNAIEAMEGQPTRLLTIAARPHGVDMMEIMVADTGNGISEEMQDQLFLPFISTKARGMGLGLSICRTIVEAHGGQMTVESGANGGATFKFTLLCPPKETPHGD